MNLFAELSDEAVAILKAAGHAVETFVMTEAAKLIAMAAGTDFGTTLLNLISAQESSALTGEQKMEAVVAAAIHEGEQFLAAGGFTGIFASVEHFVQGAAQMVFNDFAADIAKVKAG